jgi:hypothetical protein
MAVLPEPVAPTIPKQLSGVLVLELVAVTTFALGFYDESSTSLPAVALKI